jgi:hypothetical protein
VDDLAGEVAWLPRRACAGWRPVRSPRAPAEVGWASGGDGAGGGSANHARQQNENAQQTSCQWRRIARSERHVLASFSQISSTRDRR